MDSKTSVGGRIKKARLKAKLTQAKLAQRCGMSPDWVCAIERGHRRAELGTMMRLAHALNLTVEQIVGVPKNNHKPQRKGNDNGKQD
jgi:transcriptional regulator with XRE-family HTH domain